MPKHSKNNSGLFSFTYEERKKLKNDYGTSKKVLNNEFQKSFECCNICLKKAREPLSCSEGHIFCKDCIIENLIKQKKIIKQNLKKKIKIENLNLEKRYKINDFNTNTNELRDYNDKLFNYTLKCEKDRDDIDKNKLIKEIKNEDDVLIVSNKKENDKKIEKNFWINSKNDNNNNIEYKPIKYMKCPGDNKHKIKLKYLYKVEFNEKNEMIGCSFCDSHLNFQKIILIVTCGHLYCKSCINSIDNKCFCGKEFTNKDLINICESTTGYSSHNNIEVNVYKTTFKV